MTKGIGPYNGSVGHSGGAETSADAAASFDGESLCAAVLWYIQEAGERGLTRDEIHATYGGRYQPSTISARLTELTIAGRIGDSGQRRMASTKRKHIVWVSAKWLPAQMELLT